MTQTLPDELPIGEGTTTLDWIRLAHPWLGDLLDRMEREIARLRARDTEAAQFVESVICMRTHFTGDEPYTGWQGLGLALSEALDHRDRLDKALYEIGQFHEVSGRAAMHMIRVACEARRSFRGADEP